MRLLHGGVAVAVGAADALATAKLTRVGPMGIPYPVYVEAAAVLGGLFGDKLGIPSEARDALLISGLALGGSRLTRVATKGALLQGPRAWGGDVMQTDASAAAGGGPALPAARPGIRQLPAARGGYLGPSLYSGQSEPAGVAG